MATYTFRPVAAIDPNTNTVVRNASGQLFAVEDEAFATPLTFTDLSGVAQTELRVGPYGVTDGFRIDDYPRVLWKSGPYIVDLWSPDAIRDAATTAAAAAEAALAQVEALSDESIGGLAQSASDAAIAAQAAQAAAEAASLVATTPRNDNGEVADGAPFDPIRFMRGTHAQWDASTFVPPEGMPLLAIDELAGTVELRFGNGVDTWASLPQITGGGDGGAGGPIVVTDITDSTALGRALMKAADAPAARVSLGVEWLIGGTGSPEGVTTAPVGTVYRRLDGTTNQALYVKETGTGSTGWKAVGGVVTAASLGLSSYANVNPTALPLSTATSAYVADVPHIYRFNGTSYPSVPSTTPPGFAMFDAEGYPSAPPPTAGGRPAAAENDFWFPDHTVA